LKESGGHVYLIAAIAMLALAAIGYVSGGTYYEVYFALLALGAALIIVTLTELDFYSVRKKLVDIEKKLDDLKRLEEKRTDHQS